MEKIRRKTQTKRKTPFIKTLLITMLATVALVAGGVSMAYGAETDAPAFAKKLVDNGDGTYTLSLNVTGAKESSTVETVNKANVILVLDTSSSMYNSAGSTYYTVPGIPGNPNTGGVNATYYRQNGAGYSQVYYRNGNWYTSQNGGTQFTGPFYSTSRFWAEYHALTDDGGIVDSLLAQNTTINPDIIEIGIASFGGAGETNLDFSGSSNTNAAAIKNVISGLSVTQGTNWEEGLIEAHNIYNTLSADEKENETTYVVFLTDGQPTTHYNDHSVSQDVSAEFDAAKDNARSLVADDGAEFYGVFTWGDQRYYQCVQSLVGYAYTGTGNYDTGDQGKGSNVFNATSTQALIDALKQIADVITNNVGYTDTGVHDGVTSMTSSSVKANASGTVTGVKYYRSGGSYGEADPDAGNYGTEWEDAPEASIGEDGVINWELGDGFDLEDKVTYTMTFVVWPKQASLDLVADLNNGIRSYDSLTPDEKSQITVSGGKYYLKTNTDFPSVTYKTYTEEVDDSGQPIPGTRVESDLKTSEIANPDPVGLAEEKLNALKIWEDSLDPSQREDVGDSVTLYLMVDGDYYYVDEDGKPIGVTLQKSEDWEKSDYISIAPGIMVTEDSPAYDPNATQVTYDGVTYALIEEGHDYVFKESESDKHFELTAYHHHPMIMGENTDGSLHVVDVIFTYAADGKTITGIEDIKELSDSLSATNTLKGGINITKVVVDEEGEAIDDLNPFEIKITMTDPDGNALPTKTVAEGDPQAGTEYTIDYRIYYGPNNPNYDAASSQNRSDHIYKTGTEFTETIYVGDVIRIVNVEDDTIYTVTETAPTGYEYVSTTYEIAYGGKAENRKADPDHQVQGNSASYAEVTNKYTFGDLEVSKTVTVPAGYTKDASKEFEFTFKLFSDENKTTELEGQKYNYTITPASGSATEGTITEGGTFKLKDGDTIKFEKLPEAAYYEVTETTPAGYTISSKTGDTGTIVKNETASAAFTNAYSASGKVDPPVKKDITGTEELYNKGDFTFVIANTAAPTGVTAPMPTNTSITNSATYELDDKEGYYEFGEITFTVPGTYTYSVTESGSVLGVTNDSEATKTITFTVTDNGDGTLSVDPATDSAVFAFTNAYKTGRLEITKTVVNAANPEDNTKFTFTVTFADATGAAIEGSFPYTIGDSATGTIASGGTVQLANGETAIITELPDGVTYTVTETVIDGYTPDKTSATGTIDDEQAAAVEFINTYSAEGEESITVTKELAGAAWPTGKTLTLTLTGEDDETPMPETTTATLTAAGDVTFGPIAFDESDAGKTYTYTVSEGDGFGGAWTKSGDVTAKITVTDKGDGTLDTSVEYTPENATIINTYEAEGEESITVTKALAGAAWPTGKTLTLTLTGEDDETPMPETTTATLTAAGDVTFGPIKFDESDAGKTYTYTVSEGDGFGGAWTGSPDSITAKVTVTDNGDGTLGTSVEYTPEDATIINTYKAEGSVALEASKELIGREWKEGESFTFTLLDDKGAKYDEQTVSSNTSVTFKAFKYTEADAGKTYTYTISETGTLPDGVNKSGDITATVEVSDNGDGTLGTKVTYTAEDKIINTYVAEPVKAKINVSKTIDGYISGEDPNGNVVDRTFTVTMAGPKIEGEMTVNITTVGGTGSAEFGEIEYTFADMVDDEGKQLTKKEFTYTVKETAGTDAGFTYDDNEYEVVVTVEDNLNGQLEVTDITKLGAETNVEIVNVFKEEGVDVVLTVNKEIEDLSDSAEDATFTFQLKNSAGEVIDEKEITTVDFKGSVSFDKLSFDKAGEYAYTIIESKGGEGDAWTNDTTEHHVTIVVNDNFETAVLTETTSIDGESTTEVTFTNIYKAASTTSTLQVTKKVEDKSGSAPDVTFEFTLAPDGDVPMPESDTTVSIKDGETGSFGEITYEKQGEFAYTITETKGGEGDAWTNDMKAYKVVVTVADEAGKLAATVVYEGDDPTKLTVTNIYEPKPATATPQARKVIEEVAGTAPDDVEFTFDLLDPDGKVVETVTITGGGYVNFSELTFDKVGDYKYQIKEKEGSAYGFTYDTSAHDVVISVTDPGTGQLKAEINYGETGECVITNPFEVDPVSIDPPVQKIVKGNPSTAETFTFQLKAVTADAPMPDDQVGGTKTITIAGSGSKEFGEINYYEAAEYTYEITEIAGSAKGYTYDDTKYFLAVVITADKEGRLSVSEAIVDGSGNSVDKAVFTNTYEEEPPTIPTTGDDLAGVMTPLALVALASGLVTLGLGRKLRKED